jgi:hypothetical protein
VLRSTGASYLSPCINFKSFIDNFFCLDWQKIIFFSAGHVIVSEI